MQHRHMWMPRQACFLNMLENFQFMGPGRISADNLQCIVRCYFTTREDQPDRRKAPGAELVNNFVGVFAGVNHIVDVDCVVTARDVLLYLFNIFQSWLTMVE